MKTIIIFGKMDFVVVYLEALQQLWKRGVAVMDW